MSKTCATCDHYKEAHCECRRRSPTALLRCYASGGEYWEGTWPPVESGSSCGDHQPREQPEQWALVELLGHRQYAGRVIGSGWPRTVIVPEVERVEEGHFWVEEQKHYVWQHRTYTIPQLPPITIGGGALFQMTPLGEAEARKKAGEIGHRPEGWEPENVRIENVDESEGGSDDRPF